MLTDDWCSEVIVPDVDCSKPGIYKWEIDAVGIYIGKFTRINRPKKEYRRNVERILGGRLSHHPDGRFRRVHHALADAVRSGRRITLTILTNGAPEELDVLEQRYIRSEGANLNGTGTSLPP